MPHIQAGILAAVPTQACFLSFHARPGASLPASLWTLSLLADGEHTVVGFGESLVHALGRSIDGLRSMPVHHTAGIGLPSTPAALWCWLRGDDRGELLHRARNLEKALAPAFMLNQRIDAFRYGTGLDLSGYEDGTENPTGDAAVATAALDGRGPGLDGSSFVAVQQWLHDLDAFDAMSPAVQDQTIGRRRRDNEEIDAAPPSAHVKRTAQESFEPEAFVLRRSMPWAEAGRSGLVFTAFAVSFSPFEALLNRMIGGEDGIHDALFNFTRPISGAYYWCPPVTGGHIDLRALDLR